MASGALILDSTTPRRNAPAWLKRACIYHVDGVTGTLSGVIERLPTLAQLSANAVWLPSSLAESGAYEELFQSAHARGMRVILSLDSSLSNDQELIDGARYWIERGVDGFVINASRGQPIQKLRRELQSVKSDIALVADANANADQCDGVLDDLFHDRITAFMVLENESAADFWQFFEHHHQSFQDGPTRITYLDDQLLSLVHGDAERFKLATMLQLTLPSAAVISGAVDTKDRDVIEFYRSILFWRSKHGITEATPSLVHAGDDGTLIYVTGPWLILLNRSDDDIEIDLGSYGSLWLMLATSNAVRLHGSRLILSRYSGAVLGNERARQTMR